MAIYVKPEYNILNFYKVIVLLLCNTNNIKLHNPCLQKIVPHRSFVAFHKILQKICVNLCNLWTI